MSKKIRTEEEKIVRQIKLGIIGGVTVVALVIGGFVFFEKIPNGYVGVRYSINGGVRNDTLGQGVKFVGLDKVTKYPTRLQTVSAKNVQIATKDGKKVAIDLHYDYKVDPTQVSKMFKEFGDVKAEELEKGWLRSRLKKEAREVYSNYNLLDLLSGKSSEAEQSVQLAFAESVEAKGFMVENITASVPDIDDETQKTIDGIIRAGQENERAKLDAETQKTQAETEASIAKTKADTKAYEKLTQAEAEAQANQKLAESITDELIRMKEAEARLEHGWVTIQGTDNVIVDATK